MQGIAEVEGRGVLDQSWQRQSFMLLDEVETGVGAFWWEPRVYSCLLVSLGVGGILGGGV